MDQQIRNTAEKNSAPTVTPDTIEVPVQRTEHDKQLILSSSSLQH